MAQFSNGVPDSILQDLFEREHHTHPRLFQDQMRAPRTRDDEVFRWCVCGLPGGHHKMSCPEAT